MPPWRRIGEPATAAPRRDPEGELRERLLAAVEGLRAELAERDVYLRETVRDLLAVALDALLPALREERLLRALEVLVAEVFEAGRSAPQTLIVEVPACAHATRAARLPALLAEVGVEVGYEIRPLTDGELLRLSVGESWAELDAGALAAAARDRIRAALEAAARGTPETEGDDDDRDG